MHRDPILRTFDGQDFEFKGVPGHVYSLLTVPDIFQVDIPLFPRQAVSSFRNATCYNLLHLNSKPPAYENLVFLGTTYRRLC
jgi:hypothetical protein